MAMSKATSVKWGYAGVFPGEFRIWDGDQTMNRLRFMVDNGFHSTGLSYAVLREMAEDSARREQIGEFTRENNLRITLHPPGGVLDRDAGELRQDFEKFLKQLHELGPELNTPIVTLSVGPYHRYMANPTLEQQMRLLEERLKPLAAGCAEAGRPLGIENHADYWCGDLVELCGKVPGLGIFLDTGNTVIVGEKPVPACREAAPFTIGTHFKDHVLHVQTKGLSLILKGAALGHGHVGLRQIFHDLTRLHPAPEKLVMQWEMIPGVDEDPWVSLEKSWEFCRGLEAE